MDTKSPTPEFIAKAADTLNLSRQELLRKPPYIIKQMLSRQSPEKPPEKRVFKPSQSTRTQVDFDADVNRQNNKIKRRTFLTQCIRDAQVAKQSLQPLTSTLSVADSHVLQEELKRLDGIEKYSQAELDEIDQSIRSEIQTLRQICKVCQSVSVSDKMRTHFTDKLRRMETQLATT